MVGLTRSDSVKLIKSLSLPRAGGVKKIPCSNLGCNGMLTISRLRREFSLREVHLKNTDRTYEDRRNNPTSYLQVQSSSFVIYSIKLLCLYVPSPILSVYSLLGDYGVMHKAIYLHRCFTLSVIPYA
jgi:hypothetical protein